MVWEVKNHAYLRQHKETVVHSHLFVAPIKITKLYKRERIHFVSAPCGEHYCCRINYARKIRQPFCIFLDDVFHIREYGAYSSRFHNLFLRCGLFLIALSYLIRYASVASAPISLGSKRCFWRCVFCFKTFKMIKLIIAKIKKVVSFLFYIRS